MYASGYSQVSKSSPQAQKKTQYRSKGKSCGYYMRIVFFFSSLIQSLIIVSLVLFLIYGKTQDSASTVRIQDLEESFSRLSIENVALRHQRKNLTNLLNTTLTEKARNDWDLAKLRYFSNISAILIQDIDKKLQQCNQKLFFCESMGSSTARCPTTFQLPNSCNCGLMTEQLKARLALVESNFTQTAQRMRMEMDQTAKERDRINLEAIHLRRHKSTHEKEVEFFRQKCKNDFSESLSGITNVSKAFLEKIDSLFPSHIAFQLTCSKQREHLEQIRTNCTSLSMEVEDKLQHYLNVVGEQVSGIQAENSRLKAENWRLSDDYRWCSMNRTDLILQHKRNLDKLQRKHDEDKEILLMDKMRLNGEIEVLNNDVKYKSKSFDHLTERMKQLNMSCTSKTGFSGFPGGAAGAGSPFGSAFNKPAAAGAGSPFGSAFNKPAAAGAGSPFGSAFNKPAAAGAGSPFGSAFNKPAATGAGSPFGSAFNKPVATGAGSSTGSTFNKPALSGKTSIFGTSSASSGIGSNKPTSSVKSSSGLGSSSGSTGSTGSTTKSGSTNSGFSWFGSSNSGQSKTGSGTGRGPSTGNSGGIGSPSDAGRTSGLGGGSISVAQHIRDLQRIINPSGPEDKQDLSRMLG
ncbi:plasmalemma vesicle associated protein a [Anarhichas minor]|uniref:plasmalemma vesicle associated protein a n=1 Tax=Anarhichas minor TaxID=65739 RepID=UPI003F741F12